MNIIRINFFKESKNINEFNILKSFFSGSKVSIKNIVLYNEKNNEIYIDDLIIQSLHSYILNQSNKEIVFLNASDEDDVLKFNLKREYNDINQITLELKLERLPIVNEAVCRNLNGKLKVIIYFVIIFFTFFFNTFYSFLY